MVSRSTSTSSTTTAFQPRVELDDAKLQELIATIKKSGTLQPIAVRPFGAVRLIAGP